MNCRLRPDARAAVLWIAATVALLFPPAPAVAVDAPQWIAALWLPAHEAVGMRWEPVPGATGYRVLRSEEPDGTGVEVARTTDPQYIDAKVSGGESFSYVLQALVGDEVGPGSLPRTVQVPQLPPAPEPPIWRDVGLESVTRQGEARQSVRLGWTKRADLPGTNIYRSETAGGGLQDERRRGPLGSEEQRAVAAKPGSRQPRCPGVAGPIISRCRTSTVTPRSSG